jgi:hypothetical protein
MTNPSLPPELANLLGLAQTDSATTAEGLRLLRAFVRIENATTRLALIEFAERMAGLAPQPC